PAAAAARGERGPPRSSGPGGRRAGRRLASRSTAQGPRPAWLANRCRDGAPPWSSLLPTGNGIHGLWRAGLRRTGEGRSREADRAAALSPDALRWAGGPGPVASAVLASAGL